MKTGNYKVTCLDDDWCVAHIKGDQVTLKKNWDSSGGEWIPKNEQEPAQLTLEEWMNENTGIKRIIPVNIIPQKEEPKKEEVKPPEYYYINFYTSNGRDKIRGEWKTSDEASKEESTSYLYTTRLGYTFTEQGRISHKEVQEMANEHNVSIGEVLNHV